MRASSSGESTSITLDTLPPPAAAPTSPQKQQQQWGVVATPQIRSKPIEIGLRGGATSTVTVTPVSPRSPTVWAGAAKPPSQRSGTALNVGSAAQAAAAAAASAARPTSPGATTRARFGEAQTLQPIVDSIGRGLTVRVLYFSHLVTDSSAPRCPRVAASASTALSASTLDSLATLLPCLQSGDVIEPSEHVLTFATRDSGAATSTAGGVAAATAGAVLERFLSDVKSPRAAAFKYGDELVLQVPVDASAGRMHVRVLGANDALAPHARDLGGGALTIDVHVRVSHCHVHAIDWCGRAAIVTLPLMMRCDAALAELIDALSGVRASARVTDDEYSTSSAAREPPTVANACLFVPPLGCECHAAVRLEAALAAMATAPAIGAATPPPPAYPDGRYALPSDEVYVALEALLHHQHASIVPFVGGAAHSVRVRRRAQYSVLSVYERRGEPAAPQPVDLYAPVRNILGVLGASGIADDACVLLHVRDRSAGGGEFGAHLLPLDAPLVRYHARFGDELQRGLSLQKPWRVRVVYGDGASDTIDVRSTWTVEQLTQTALATPAARADKRRVQLIGAFVPAAKSPTASEEASGAPLVADTNTNSWGRWLAPTEAVLACRPLHDTSCMMLRQREWKVKVEIIAGSGVAAAQATFVALDPFQSLASAALKVLERVAGGSNVEQHCVFVQYPVSGDRGGARVFGEWLSDVSDETRLVYQAYNRCAARYAAEREREWCDALQRLQLHHRDVLEGVVAADDSETAVVGGEVSYLQASRDLGAMFVMARKVVVHVALADNTSKAVPALATASVHELVQQTAKKIGLKNTTGFAFFCTDRGVWLEPGLSMPEQGVGLASAGGADDTNSGMNVVRVRMLRRYVLSDPQLLAQQSDAVALTLAYAQVRGLVLSGALALAPAVAVRLAALQMRVQFGEYVPRTHRAGFLTGKLLADFLPPPADKSYELPIYSAYSSLSALSGTAAMIQYIAMCRAPDVSLSDELLQCYGFVYSAELKKRGGLARTKVFADLEPAAQRLTLRKGDVVQRALELDNVVRITRHHAAPRSVAMTFRKRTATTATATTNGPPLSPPGSPLRDARGRSGTIDSRMTSLKRMLNSSVGVGSSGGGDDDDVQDELPESADETTLEFVFASCVESEQFFRSVHACIAGTLTGGGVGAAPAVETIGAARPLRAHALYCGAPRTTVCDGMRVWVGTWNLGGAAPEADKLAAWIALDAADVYCIGTQEARYERNKEQGVEDWSAVLQRHFGAAFYVVASVTMWEIGLVVYARREHAGRISGVATATKATGIAGIAGNKGAVGAAFALHQTTFCVVSSHLAARADHKRLMNRNENFGEIADDLAVGLRKKLGIDVLTQFDVVLWTGDLNYRVELSRAELMRLVTTVPLERHRMLRHDQLRAERAAQRAFATFAEPALRFLPTYRMERHADGYCEQVKAKLTVQNAPSWCDRVLYQAQRDVCVVPVAYEASAALRTSDHRPVAALFHVELPLVPHPFAAQAHAFQILLYDVVVRLRRAADVLRAASGAAPSAPPRQLTLRLVSPLLDDKASRIAVAPTTRTTLTLNAGSDPPRYQGVASCIALGPFVALSGWCVAGEHVGVLVTESKSDSDVVAQCALPLAARFEVGPPTTVALTLARGGVPCGKLEMAIHVTMDEKTSL
jgi:hypothetical protein